MAQTDPGKRRHFEDDVNVLPLSTEPFHLYLSADQSGLLRQGAARTTKPRSILSTHKSTRTVRYNNVLVQVVYTVFLADSYLLLSDKQSEINLTLFVLLASDQRGEVGGGVGRGEGRGGRRWEPSGGGAQLRAQREKKVRCRNCVCATCVFSLAGTNTRNFQQPCEISVLTQPNKTFPSICCWLSSVVVTEI